MEIAEINDKITTNVTKDSKKSIRNLIKNGYATIDGVFYQYNPTLTDFERVNDSDVIAEYHRHTTNSWNIQSNAELTVLLKEALPTFTSTEVNQFKNYIRQSQIKIDNAKINRLMKSAIQENDSNKYDKDFKGRYNLTSQILVLHNNDIFSVNRNVLVQLVDGEFKRITSEDLKSILNNAIADDHKIMLQEIKNNFQLYTDNLINVEELYDLIQQKQIKESVMKESKGSYEKVIKTMEKYQ